MQNLLQELKALNVTDAQLDFTRLFYMLSQDMDQMTHHADIKANMILGVNAILLATTSNSNVSGFSFITIPPAQLTGVVMVLSVLMIVTLLSSIFCALITVVPRTYKGPKQGNLYFFGYITTLGQDDFTQRFLNMSMSELKVAIIEQIYAKAHIVERKYAAVRWSMNFLFLAVLFWALARLMLTFA
ncbi:MAG: DUF5706 domain-containing protein [Anaerolineae bacterium]